MTQTALANLALSKLGNTIIDDIDDTGSPQARVAKLHYEPTLREVLRTHFWGFAMGVISLTPKADKVVISGTITPSLAAQDYEASADEEDWTHVYLGLTEPTVKIIWNSTESKWQIMASEIFGFGISLWHSNVLPAPGNPSEATEWTVSGIDSSGTPVVSLVSPASDLLEWTKAFEIPADFIKLRRVLDEAGGKIEEFDFRRVNGTRCIVTGDYDLISLDYVQFVDEPNDYDPHFIAAFTTLLASKIARAITGSEAMEGQLRQLYEAICLPDARTSDGQDSRSNENHPLQEFLSGDLMRTRGNFFGEDQD